MTPGSLHRESSLSLRASALAWAALAAVSLAAQFAVPAQRAELALLDAQFAALRALGPKPVASDVVLVGIDEATLEAFPEPIALWHRRLAAVLDGVARARPRAVGLDLQLPDRSYDAVQPGLDAALVRALHAMRAAAPFVVVLGIDGGGGLKPVHAPFIAAVGEGGAGLSTWVMDADAQVRRFDEGQGADGGDVPTFAGVLARRLGAAPRPGLLDFALGPAYAYVPAHQVAAWAAANDAARLEAAFAGRVVLIGSVLPFVDRHAVPVRLAGWEDHRTAPGVLLHAQALRALLGPGLITAAPLPAALGIVLVGVCLWFAFARLGFGLAAVALFVVGALALSTWLLYRGTQLPVAGSIATAVVAGAARTAYEAWFNRRQRQRLRQAFAGAVSPNVLELILRGDLDSAMGTGRRNVCVMFGDIRGFTPLSERREPEEVVALLNRYFERITTCAHRHGGTVDNFRGDGIMCVFGAPLPAQDPCRAGFAAARDMLGEVDALNRELESEGLPPIRIGLSLAYGEAIVGRVGAAERNEYTAIGDVANVSAHIEGLGSDIGYALVVTDAVVAALRGDASFDDLGARALKGHSPVRVFGWPARQQVERAA